MRKITKRNTVQKTLILDTVRAMFDHPTADEVYAAVSEKYPAIGRATVYRVLKSLSEEGLIRRVAVANAPDRFDFTLAPHAHCLCVSCGRVDDFELPCPLPMPDGNGFTPAEVSVIVTGLCRDCNKA